MKKHIKIVGLCISMTILVQFQGCSPGVTGLSTQGTIIATENDRVYTLFEDVLGNEGTFTGSWFYFPGAGIINKENYRIKVILEENK